MKIPSLKYLIRKSSNTLYRFPFTLSVAFIGTFAALYVVDFHYNEYKDYTDWYHLIMTCAIGIPLFLSLTVFSERLEVSFKIKLITRCAGFIFLFLYFISLPDIFLEKHLIRMFIYLLFFHLVVSFSAFIGFKQQNAFWQFNKHLFIRLLVTILYSLVLYIGISLALLAIDQLFEARINEEWYLRLWIIIVGIFSVWFFLAGVPKHYNKLENIQHYPAGIKIFTQYILIPLVTAYAIILYAYFVKVIVTHDWPMGWVVYLVSGYSLLGIFAFLLLYPIHNETSNKGIRTYSRIFFYSLFPLLIMFFVAITKRIIEYGLTENRLFIVLLGIWLLVISIFILFTKFKMIRMVPISLAIIAFLSVSGPWNVFKISKWQQKNRLESILIKNNILENGKVVKINKEIPLNDDVEICSIITYMADMHGHHSLQPFFTQNLDTIFKRDSTMYFSSYNGILKLTELMGIEYNLYRGYMENDSTYQFSFSSLYDTSEIPLKVSGYDYFINYRSYYYNFPEQNNDSIIKNTYLLSDSSKIELTFSSSKGLLSIFHKDSLLTSFNLFSFLQKLEKFEKTGQNGYYQVEKNKMTVLSDSTSVPFKIIFTYLTGDKQNNVFHSIHEVQADILLKTDK